MLFPIVLFGKPEYEKGITGHILYKQEGKQLY